MLYPRNLALPNKPTQLHLVCDIKFTSITLQHKSLKFIGDGFSRKQRQMTVARRTLDASFGAYIPQLVIEKRKAMNHNYWPELKRGPQWTLCFRLSIANP